VGLLQRASVVPVTMPLSPEQLETPSPEILPPPARQRPRTDADIVVASRDHLLENQLRATAAAVAADREGHPIT